MFVLKTKRNQINNSASMIQANITFTNFGKPFYNVKYRKNVKSKAGLGLF